jgi:peptidoglycan/LPS O-acetylase OafA/YrhL
LTTGINPGSDRLTPARTSAGTISDNHWPFLDLIRFGGALLVLFGHSRGLLFEGIGRVEHPNVLLKGLYLVSGLQHEGVVLFFVVSGFLVGGSVWRLTRQGRFDFGTYFINRFARIYLVYIPALLFVLLITIAGKHFFLDTRFYGMRPLLPANIFDEWTWEQIPCHLVALQGVLCTPWGADLPVWSLGYEWAFYLIAPAVFAVALKTTTRRGTWLVPLLVLPAALTWWNPDWLIWFLMWLLGTWAARTFESGGLSLPLGLAGLLICGCGLVLSRLAVVPSLATDAMVAIGIAAAVANRDLMQLSGRIPAIKRGAAFSYSLYLIHLPLCVFVGALYERFLYWPSNLVQPDLRGLLGFAGMVLIALFGARLFAAVTEDHTSVFRRKLMALRASCGFRNRTAA